MMERGTSRWEDIKLLAEEHNNQLLHVLDGDI